MLNRQIPGSPKEGMIKEQDKDYVPVKMLFRYASIPIARLLARTNITPNKITVFNSLFSVVIAYLFYLGEHTYIALASALLLISYILDYVDGSLARLKGLSSEFGTWLDQFTDIFLYVIIFLGITWGIYNRTGNYLIWLLGYLTATANMARVLMYIYFRKFHFADKVIKQRRRIGIFKNFFFEHTLLMPVIIIGGFFDKLFYAMLFLGIWGWIYSFMLYLKLSLVVYNNTRKKVI